MEDFPPSLFNYVTGTAKQAEVDQTLKARDELLNDLRHNIQLAQNRMKQLYDSKHSERRHGLCQIAPI